MKKKKLYNYKKALNIPLMIQKLFKGFTLENPIELMKIGVFVVTIVLELTIFKPVINVFGIIPGLNIAILFLLPMGVTMLWDKLEPDGLKIPQYVGDYVMYFLTYKIGKKVINQDQVTKEIDELIVFEKIEG